MMALEKKKLSLKEKIDYIPALVSIIGTAFTALLTGPFRGSGGAATYNHHLAHAFVRKFNSRLSSLQSQYLQPSFSKAYEKWCASKDILPEFVTTDTGLRGFWLGDKAKAKYVVVYYHGGGFALDGTDGHLDCWYEIQQDVGKAGITTAFFFVLYTLTPHAVYPTQLNEAVQALKYVANECQRAPSSILLAGDSAGGNLAVSVLLHLSKPNPRVETYHVKEKLKGLILMAPWVSLDVTWPSYQRNKHKDYIEADVEQRWANEYLAGNSHDEYTDPALASAESWKDAMTSHILVVFGSDEALYDGILDWVDRYRSAPNNNITVVIGKGEVHNAPIVWPIFGDKHETEQMKAIKQYMKHHLAM